MNRIIASVAAALCVALSPIVALAANDTGNPTGSVDKTSSCQLVTGWSYDADFDPTIIEGCMNMTATNYDRNATVDNGSCVFVQEPCVSRYRWVNITAGTVNQTQACSAVGATPVLQNISERGFCASGEARPQSGYDVAKINYSRGIWGGGVTGGTLMPFQNGGYRCYTPGQKQDRDNTDVTVAYYCDFGAAFPESCPADNPPPRTYSGSGGGFDGGRYSNKVLLNFNAGSLIKSLAALFKPFQAVAASSDSNFVEIYDGPRDTTGTLVATVPANIYRADVNATMNITGNHGFSWAVPAAYSDGTPRAFYFYGTDTDTAGKTNALSNSPMTFTCFGAANGGPSSPNLSCPAQVAAGSPATISFSSSDSDGDQIRFAIDWDGDSSVDQYVPSGGYAPSGASQSASRTWASSGAKKVSVTAQDSQGNTSSSASCSIAVTSGTTVTEDPVDGGGGTTPPGTNPEASGFTVSGTSKLKVQFLGGLSAKTQEANLSVNAIRYTEPVILSVDSIRSAQGAGLPADVEATYYFGGAPAQSMAMAYDAASGMYRDASGRIGTTFSVGFSKKIAQKYFLTIVGSSGANRAEFVIEIEPDAVNPDFREI